MAMVEDVKKILGITAGVTDFDQIIASTIEAGYSELQTLGIIFSHSDALIDNCVMNYVLSELDTPNKELYANAFAFKVDKLRRCKEYTE